MKLSHGQYLVCTEYLGCILANEEDEGTCLGMDMLK